MTVTPIKPGVSLQSAEEAQIVNELAAKVRQFVEQNDTLPTCATLVLWAPTPEGLSWSTGYFAPAADKGRLEAFGLAGAILNKSLAD